nr:hypothetical protein [Parerythrobacter lutipelagi]
MTDRKSSDASRSAWKKPSVRSITPVKRTAAGPVRRTIEDPFYNPS